MTVLELKLKDFIIEAIHGVNESEKTHAQPFRINLTVQIRTHNSDELNNTFNWSTLRNITRDVTLGNSFNLVESLARAIAEKILSYPNVLKVIVEIDKLHAFDNGIPGVHLEITN